MSNVITRPFSLTRDFRSIMWGATFQYNVLRAACAGLVVAIIMTVVAIKAPPGQGPPIPIIMLLPIFWPIAFFLVFFPASLVIAWFSELIPAAAFVAVCYALMFVAIGDPIVCILRRYFPRLVPVERPAFFSVRPIYWILKPDETSEIAVSH